MESDGKHGPIAKGIIEFQRKQREKSKPPHITCPTCGRTSYNADDIQQRYCGHCKQFHDDMEKHDGNQDQR